MATNIVTPALGVAQLAATLSGVPFAAGAVMVLQMINNTCSQVSLHKQKCAQLVDRCTSLLNAISEHSSSLVGTDAIAAFDQAETVLSGVHRRIQKWANCGKYERLFKSAQIARDLDKCHADVNHAMEQLHIASPATLIRMQKETNDMMRHQQATIETLQQLIISPREIERAVQQHSSGGNEAHELMRLGQERLIQIRQEAPVPSTTILSDGRQVSQSPVTSRPPSPTTTVQNEIEKSLRELYRLTQIPPAIHILNNQVRITSMLPARGGPYSVIYDGRWLGEKKVALKTLRVVDEHDPRAKRLQMRFENEITVWSKLKHENVLSMLGIVTNMGPIYIASPWQLDNVRNYRYDNPDVNPLKLLGQAAKGLVYLHDQQIVHGNLKCNNMLVSEGGIVTLSDFGLTQVLNEIVGKPTMVALSTLAAVRWQAPEINDDESMLTMASDVFAFGMSVLELLTLKPPYSHRLRDYTVAQDVIHGRLPHRPQEPEAVPWMSDALWEALQRCWKWNPEERMQAKEVLQCLERASEVSTTPGVSASDVCSEFLDTSCDT